MRMIEQMSTNQDFDKKKNNSRICVHILLHLI